MRQHDVVQLLIRRVVAEGFSWPDYMVDLQLEAVARAAIEGQVARNGLAFVESVLTRRKRESRGPLTVGNCYFNCIQAVMYQLTGETPYVAGLVDVADAWRRSAPRVHHGLAGHCDQPAGAVFLDMLGGYAPLMALAGSLSGKNEYNEECVGQLEGCRTLLACASTGLWHHAIGWHQPESSVLAPAGWARGQAWVLRGMVGALDWLPKTSGAAGLMRHRLRELVDTVLGYQTRGGFWRQIMWRPDAYAETSGTGLITHVLRHAVSRGYLSGKKYDVAILRAQQALVSEVNEEGLVCGGCVSTPPLATVDEYLRLRCVAGDKHAQAAALLAFV